MRSRGTADRQVARRRSGRSTRPCRWSGRSSFRAPSGRERVEPARRPDSRQHLRMTDASFDLARFPVHLGFGATVVPLAEFDGTPEWYERYATAHAGDGAEGRLVSLHTF